MTRRATTPMNYADLVRRRIRTQRLTRSEFTDPAQVISWLGAVQAQDYAGATWAVGQRTRGLTNVHVDRAFDEGRILRTHVLRPTWHFVTPADIRWIQTLSAPRVHSFNGSMYRSLELDRELVAVERTGIGRVADRFAHHVLLNGRLAGSWSRTLTASTVTLTVATHTPLSRADITALGAAADRYRRFLGLSNFDTITV